MSICVVCDRVHPAPVCISFSFLFFVYFVIIATSAGIGIENGNWNGNMGIRIEIGTCGVLCLGLGLRHIIFWPAHSLPCHGVFFVGRMIRLSSSQILSSLSAVLVSSLFSLYVCFITVALYNCNLQ